jgi:CDP-diacylglycerol---glycerol-3-phosphate 3-phosphatidyltransferase
VALFGRGLWSNVAALGLTVAAISLDAVDGYLARRFGLATPLGAQLDILGDRLIENVFFTYFAVAGEVSLWVPVFFFFRGTVTDFVRGLAVKAGRAGFGKNSMMESRWGRAIVSSRASRVAYGVLKCACFCYLGFELTLRSAGTPNHEMLAIGGQIMVWATVTFCLVRGLPVVWEGRRYVVALSAPAVGAARGARASRVDWIAGAAR